MPRPIRPAQLEPAERTPAAELPDRPIRPEWITVRPDRAPAERPTGELRAPARRRPMHAPTDG
ncbi:MAG TPA: hypothetical protein VD763_13455 [Candidatus Saccharimonadales bacterium]|nr:hypothetical protein [Candidatus Saccharimonadales bacterium]